MKRKSANKHALQRLKSRQGIKDKTKAFAQAENALEYGTRVKDLPDGEIKDFLFAKYKSNSQRKRVYLYEDNLYVFTNDKVLITTYPLEIRRDYGKQ